MRNLIAVSIDRMIVHIINVRSGNNTVLSDVPVDLSKNPITEEYFQNHIKNVSQDNAAGFAGLADKYKPEMAPVYQQIITQPSEFVSASQILGKRLHEIMLKDQRIAPGDLVVCVFKASNYPDKPMLALLKLDPTQAILHYSGKDKKGRWIVTLKVVPDALPTLGERLQKAAFVKPTNSTKWKLLVLDRQVGKPDERPAAYFFLKRFLGAAWKLTPESRLKRLYGKIIDFAFTLKKSDDPLQRKEADTIIQSLDTALCTQKEIDIDNYIENLKIREKTSKNLKEQLEKVLDKKIFKIDDDTAKRLTRKVKYRGEDGLMLNAPSNVYKALVTEEIIKENGVPKHRITIKTRYWQRLRP